MKTFVHGLMIDTIAFTRDHVCSFGRIRIRICDPRSHRSAVHQRSGALVYQISYHNSRRESVERISGIAR